MIKYNGKDIIPRIDGKEISRVMYNGKQIYPNNNNNVIEIQLADVVAGDVCVFDGTNKRFFRFVDSGATDDIKKYTPIGVVVIPTSHNVYGTGECGVMSLKAMDCDTPDEGSISEQSMQAMRWGVSTDIPTLPTLIQVPRGNTSDGIPTGQDAAAFLPSDKFSSVQCAHDMDAYYFRTYEPAPSSYLTDGSRNPGYYQTTSPSSSDNALADFDGKGNTQKILEVRGEKDYSLWKPGRNTLTDYPAASCCDMFYTDGTQQGDWYLPACGELGYIIPPFNKINKTITNLKNTYSSSIGVELNTERVYWSSTQDVSYSARCIYTYDGHIWNYNKGYPQYARAFLRVGAA